MSKLRTIEGVIVYLTEKSGNEHSGLQNSEFEIFVNTDLLRPGCAISPVESMVASSYALVIQSKPVAYGKGYMHKVRQFSEDKTSYYPTKFLEANTEFEYIGTCLPPLPHWGTWLLDYVKLD